MRADYTSFRPVLSRGVLQIVLEVPLEAGEAFIDEFGMPKPGQNVPVTLRRAGTMDEPLDVGKPRRRLHDMKPQEQAGMLAKDEAFQRFAHERGAGADIDAWIKRACGIKSKRELETDKVALVLWQDLMIEYGKWLKTVEPRERD